MTLRDVVKHHLEVVSNNNGFNWEVVLCGFVVWHVPSTGPAGRREAAMFVAELSARLLVS